MSEFLRMARPPKWPFLHIEYNRQPLPLLWSANTSSRNTGRARALLAVVVLRRPDPLNRYKTSAMAKLPAGVSASAVLFRLFRYGCQLRNLRHFFAPQLQGSLLLASSIGNL